MLLETMFDQFERSLSNRPAQKQFIFGHEKKLHTNTNRFGYGEICVTLFNLGVVKYPKLKRNITVSKKTTFA